MPTGQAHRCQDGQPSLDHGRAGDAISEGIFMRISPTFVILFGSPGYHWNHNEENFTEFQPWLIVNVCVFNEKTSLAFITKAWVGRNKRSNLYLMETKNTTFHFPLPNFVCRWPSFQNLDFKQQQLPCSSATLYHCLLLKIHVNHRGKKTRSWQLTTLFSLLFTGFSWKRIKKTKTKKN